jgi:hypothetical protein
VRKVLSTSDEGGVYRVRASFFFSSSLPSIGDRAKGDHPHVNFMDIVAAMVNASHIAIATFGWKGILPNPRITRATASFHGVILPDRDYEGTFVVSRLPNYSLNHATLGGNAEFVLQDEGMELAKVCFDFANIN